MARTRPKPQPLADTSLDLTAEEKTAAREELQKSADEAARNGVYERFRELRGKVRVDVDFYTRLREEDD